MIRDFIYVDGDRLYSVYSQVFQGVAEQIVQSYIDEYASATSNKSLRDASVETQTAEVSRRTENRLLYDHMYNQLEAKLSRSLVDGLSLDVADLVPAFATPKLVKVTGLAEVEDYTRLRVLIEKFNDLGEVIAYSHMPSADSRAAAEAEIKQIKDGNERARAKERLKATTSITALAKQLGLRQDEQLLKNLRMITEHFYPEGIDVVISSAARPELAYKAVIDRKWLRVDGALLRSLQSGLPAAGWTVVGYVTHVPGTDLELAEPESTESNIHDSFRGMFRAGREFERKFFESEARVEVVVAPIAIYREIEFHERESDA
jgi:hypothetical protein